MYCMSFRDVLRAFKTLGPEDFRALVGIELALARYEYAPLEQIYRYSELGVDSLKFHLNLLLRLGLVKRIAKQQLGYDGYTLNFSGYDCLALNAFLKSGALEFLGEPIGVGKEADVYEGFSETYGSIAVKFHRLGRISFRGTRRLRGYVGDRSHISWLYQSRLAAQREYEALRLLHPHRVSVPKPIAQNRHVVVMGLIEGMELRRFRRILKPRLTLLEILANVRRAYLKAGVIHADLSEYNIILKPNNRILIIDWPQYIVRTHRNALGALRRDMVNVLSFFNRKFHVKLKIENVLPYIVGEKNRIR